MNLQLDIRPIPTDEVPERADRAAAAGSGAGDTSFLPTHRAQLVAPDKIGNMNSMGSPNDDQRSEIMAVIAGGGPSIVFQPVVHIETSTVIGAEALSRFPGSHGPGYWFQCADELGLGIELELSAAGAACRRLETATWGRGGWDFVGLNVSPSVVVDDRFRDLVAGSVPDRIMIELTEEVGVIGPFAVRSRLDSLRERGVRVAANAIRCTWADVHRTLATEPEILKLGTDFTAALVRDPARHDEARAILDQCRRHGAFVVAVGVEHADELVTLGQLGVDAAQGHVFGWSAPDAIAPQG